MSSVTPAIPMVEDEKEIRRFVRLALETDDNLVEVVLSQGLSLLLCGRREKG